MRQIEGKLIKTEWIQLKEGFWNHETVQSRNGFFNSKWVNEEKNWDDHKFTGPKNQMKTSPLEDDFINQWTRVFESVY